MKGLFKKRALWVADKEQLAEELHEISCQLEKQHYEIKEELYWKLDEYGVYRKPYKKENSTPLWRLTAPIYYLLGVVFFIILSPLTYILGIDMTNTKLGYAFRSWEKKL